MGFRNQTRGLQIPDTAFTYLTEGAYAAVFVDRGQNRIRKIFKKGHLDEAHCKQVFQSQFEAYQIALSTKELVALVPNFYGTVPGQIINNSHGEDVTCEFYSQLAYEVELIDCAFQDIAKAGAEQENKIANLFRRYGINYLRDSSACIKDGRIMKIIDFATVEIEPYWPEID